jgi:hypothetical protein
MRILSKKFWKILKIFRKKNNFIQKDIQNPKLKFWGVTRLGCKGLSTVGRRSAQGGLAAVTPWSKRRSASFLLPPLLLWHPVLAPRFVQASTSIYSQAWRRFREMTFPGNSHD